jgi:hypothetical protein
MKGQAVPSVIRISILVLLLLTPVGGAWAQDIWIVDPGRGVGPLRIGMTQDDVLATVGKPSKEIDATVSEYLVGKHWRYDQLGIDVKFDIDTSSQNISNTDFRSVTEFAVWGPALRTRGNVGVGSSLTEVIRIFGDSMPQFSGASARQCVITNVFLDSSTGAVSVVLNYAQIGISFNLSGEGKVLTMNVKKPSHCFSIHLD